MPRKEEAVFSTPNLYNMSKLDSKFRLPHELLREGLNLEPYKNNHAWPGRTYILIGNSFNVEKNLVATTSDTNIKRSASIAMMLEKGRGNRKCVSVEDAFALPGFTECLSRFEFDWLKKQPPSTLLGPAFDERGNFIPLSFAVWRREISYVQPKELASATH